jgi:hypothetical protein
LAGPGHRKTGTITKGDKHWFMYVKWDDGRVTGHTPVRDKNYKKNQHIIVENLSLASFYFERE